MWTRRARIKIIVIPGSNAELGAEEVADAPLGPGDIAVAVFEIPQETIVTFFRRAREQGARTLLNPAPYAAFNRDLPALCDVLLLNEVELAGLAGLQEAPREKDRCFQVMHAVRQFAEQTIIVTLGGDGALALAADDCWRVPGIGVAVVDTTGAGDCFVGAFAAASARGGGATGGPRLRQRRCRPERNAARRERDNAHAGGGNRDSLADG